MSITRTLCAFGIIASIAACSDNVAEQAIGGGAVGAGVGALTGAGIGTGAAVGAGATVLACQTELANCDG